MGIRIDVSRLRALFSTLCVRGEEPGDGAPEVVKSMGEAPLQIADADPTAGAFTSVGGDFTEDFGIESYNADEIDFDGFEISDGGFS